jgi:hypothetical protein
MGWGDGAYPMYVTLDKAGRVLKVEVLLQEE